MTSRLGTQTGFAPKGLPPEARGLDGDALVRLGYNAARGDLPLPLATVSRPAVDHNIRTMARWCAQRGVLLAPHGKTTLAPDLFRRQLASGAWGMTVTTARHAEIAAAAGARRLIVANELIDPVELRTLASLAARYELQVYVFVDSEFGLRRLQSAVRAAPGRIAALVEMGIPGGRTGVRDEEALWWLLDACQSGPVDLAGVSAFEGIIRISRPLDAASSSADRESIGRMRGFLEGVATRIAGAQRRGLLARDAILTAGGSSAFDLVVDYLAPLGGPVVLRSGCYVTHDHGLYAMQSPLQDGNEPTLRDAGVLRPALWVWAHVISAPESGTVIAGFGRRDAGNDVHMPRPVSRVAGPGGREPIEGWSVTKMWDQHALLDAGPGATELAVGDVLTFGVSHPCTTFDRWRTLVEVDDNDDVVGLIETYF
jgi:D-serine deaminase-like pyridoxal phosphate-dependent protein